MSVIVLGSINIDLVARAPRFPLPGESLLGSSFETHPGGKGANQAVACARLGANTYMLGCIGTDVFGSALRDSLQSNGVQADYVTAHSNVASGVAQITVTDAGENEIVIIPGANALVGQENLNHLVALLPTASALLIQLEVPLEIVVKAARLAHEKGVSVILDPAPAQAVPPELFSYVDILTPNQVEAQFYTGQNAITPDETKRAAELLLQRGVRRVIIKMGGTGAYYSDGQTSRFLPAFTVNAVDSVAAGDAFNGALAAAIDLGFDFDVALQWALATGALSVTKKGAQESMPTRAELRAFLAAHSQK